MYIAGSVTIIVGRNWRGTEYVVGPGHHARATFQHLRAVADVVVTVGVAAEHRRALQVFQHRELVGRVVGQTGERTVGQLPLRQPPGVIVGELGLLAVSCRLVAKESGLFGRPRWATNWVDLLRTDAFLCSLFLDPSSSRGVAERT